MFTQRPNVKNWQSVTVWLCIFVLCGHFALAQSLPKCYICVSQKSFKDCNTKLTWTNCGMDYDTCLTGHIIQRSHGNTTVSHYIKMCGRKEQCVDASKKCAERGAYCKIDCCHSNLCNDAPRGEFPIASGINQSINQYLLFIHGILTVTLIKLI